MDGVLADMLAPCLLRIADLGGPVMDPNEFPTWEVFDTFDLKYREPVHAMWHERGFCRGLEPYPGAQEGVGRLQELADVVCVTAATPSGYWHQERVEWLQEHFDIPSRNVIFAFRKELVQGDVFVEDKPETLFEWAVRNRGQGVLWERSYNRPVRVPPGVIKSVSWDLVVGLVQGLLL